MLTPDRKQRQEVAEQLAKSINKVVRKNLGRKSQEPSITSKVAHDAEDELDGQRVGEYRIDVLAHDVPDKGPGSVEKKTAVDLFIGIRVVRDGQTMGMKGLVIQAKNPGAHHTSSLDEQCEKLASESARGSFVWIYDVGGTRVMAATDILENKGVPLTKIDAQSLDEHFEAFFECKDGDPKLISDDLMDNPNIVNDHLKRIYVKTTLGIDVSTGSPRSGQPGRGPRRLPKPKKRTN